MNKPCCGYCGAMGQPTYDHRQWWCGECGSLGTLRANGDVSWQAPALKDVEAVEVNGKRFVREGSK